MRKPLKSNRAEKDGWMNSENPREDEQRKEEVKEPRELNGGTDGRKVWQKKIGKKGRKWTEEARWEPKEAKKLLSLQLQKKKKNLLKG